MDQKRQEDNPEDDMQFTYRRADAALSIIVVLMASVSIGVSIYGLILFLILPLLGVGQ